MTTLDKPMLAPDIGPMSYWPRISNTPTTLPERLFWLRDVAGNSALSIHDWAETVLEHYEKFRGLHFDDVQAFNKALTTSHYALPKDL